jgi:hypothetical protein
VDRIAAVLDNLHPVAWQVHAEGHWRVVLRMVGTVVGREGGLLLDRPHVGEQQSAPLVDLVGALAEVLLDAAGRRLGRRVKNGAVDIEMPAVVAAADAALGNDAVLERCTAVHAMPMQQSDASRAIAKHHQVFAQQAHGHRQVLEFGAEQKRMPVAAQVFAAGRAGAHRGDEAVVVRRGPVVVAAVGPYVSASTLWACSIAHGAPP